MSGEMINYGESSLFFIPRPAWVHTAKAENQNKTLKHLLFAKYHLAYSEGILDCR